MRDEDHIKIGVNESKEEEHNKTQFQGWSRHGVTVTGLSGLAPVQDGVKHSICRHKALQVQRS